MVRTRSILTAGFAVLALGGGALASGPAEAGASTGTWRNGMVAGPRGVGYYGGGYGYRPYGYYRRHNNGGAVAAGLIGGLALGALAARPAYSYPAYSYPNYPVTSYPGSYGTGYYGGSSCYTVRERVVDEWGDVVVRRTQICD